MARIVLCQECHTIQRVGSKCGICGAIVVEDKKDLNRKSENKDSDPLIRKEIDQEDSDGR